MPDYLSEEHLAWGIRKNDPQLLDAANQFVAELKQDGRLQAATRRPGPSLARIW